MVGKPDETGKKTDITFGMCKECALILILELRKSKKDLFDVAKSS